MLARRASSKSVPDNESFRWLPDQHYEGRTSITRVCHLRNSEKFVRGFTISNCADYKHQVTGRNCDQRVKTLLILPSFVLFERNRCIFREPRLPWNVLPSKTLIESGLFSCLCQKTTLRFSRARNPHRSIEHFRESSILFQDIESDVC